MRSHLFKLYVAVNMCLRFEWMCDIVFLSSVWVSTTVRVCVCCVVMNAWIHDTLIWIMNWSEHKANQSVVHTLPVAKSNLRAGCCCCCYGCFFCSLLWLITIFNLLFRSSNLFLFVACCHIECTITYDIESISGENIYPFSFPILSAFSIITLAFRSTKAMRTTTL